MTAQGGFGLSAQIDVSGSPTAWAQVEEIDFPGFKKYLKESTTHDATSGYYTVTATGKRRVMPFRAVLAWDTSVSTHAAVLTAFNADTDVTVSVADPDGDETIAFECQIEEVNRMAGQEDILKCDVLIHPTGAATIT
jgi:hypothetical protein